MPMFDPQQMSQQGGWNGPIQSPWQQGGGYDPQSFAPSNYFMAPPGGSWPPGGDPQDPMQQRRRGGGRMPPGAPLGQGGFDRRGAFDPRMNMNGGGDPRGMNGGGGMNGDPRAMPPGMYGGPPMYGNNNPGAMGGGEKTGGAPGPQWFDQPIGPGSDKTSMPVVDPQRVYGGPMNSGPMPMYGGGNQQGAMGGGNNGPFGGTFAQMNNAAPQPWQQPSLAGDRNAAMSQEMASSRRF